LKGVPNFSFRSASAVRLTWRKNTAGW